MRLDHDEKFFAWSERLAWLLSLVVSVVGMTAYAFTTFEQKSHVSEIKEDIVRRLDRIERKIDKTWSE